MTVRWPLAAAGILVALVAGYLHGLSKAPTRTVETVRVERAQVRSEVATLTAQSARHESAVTLQGAVITRWKTRAIEGPCTLETSAERIEASSESRKATITDLRVVDSKASLTSVAEATQSTKVTERRSPRWAVGADGGLRFADATAVVRGRFEIRPLGPIWIGAWADADAAGLSARLEW